MERNAASDTTKGAAALHRVKKLRRREPSPLPPQRPLPLLSAICTARGPAAWNRPLAALHLHEVRIILIHPYLASSVSITPNKSGRLRDSKKSSGGGKGLCLCCRSRALTSGATKPPGRRGCDDLSGAGPMHLITRGGLAFLTCCSSCHGTLDSQHEHRMPVVTGTVARAEAYHGGDEVHLRPNHAPTPWIPEKEGARKRLQPHNFYRA